MARPILEVENLTTQFFTEDGLITAVDHVGFTVEEGKTLAVVGESGCGKSVTALSIMQLIQDPPGKIVDGTILFDGTDLLTLSEKEMLDVRGNSISMIFQEPMSSLNPVMTVGRQIVEAIQVHQGLSSAQAREKAVEALTLVGIPNAGVRMNNFPHQLSGGMRQRVMIAMALSCDSRILIADEPTTALDVTIQAQIIDLMKDLQAKQGISFILITHDMGVVAEMADSVVVMYAGQIVERSDAASLFEAPLHPYAQGLLRSIPNLDDNKDMLETIEGTVPNLLDMPAGCRFAPRCEYARPLCREKCPPLFQAPEPGHEAACWILKDYTDES